MATGPFYTPEEDARIRELFGKRLSSVAIAATLGRTKSSITSRISHLGLRRKNWFWTPADDEQLQKLASAHVPVEEIAKVLDRTISSVRKRQMDLGVSRNGRKTRLAIRYGVEALANGADTATVLANIREQEEQRREAAEAEHQAKVANLLDEMERGLNAGCDRAFMFTAALVGGATLQAIGDRVGLTRERVRQVIEKRADQQNGSEA